MHPETFADRLYEAAILPQLWEGVLADLTTAIGARGTAVIVARGTDFVRMATSCSEITHLGMDYPKHYPNNKRVVGLLEIGTAGFVQDFDLMKPGEKYLDESYEEYLIPKGFGAGLATAIHAPSGDNLIVHSEFRYTGNPISQEIVARMNGLRPHFARAALLSSRLGMERAQGMAAALDTMGLPGAVLRNNGTVMAANAAMQKLGPKVMMDRRDRATFTNSGADKLLATAIAQYRTNQKATVPASIPLKAEEDRPTMIAHLMPVRGVAHDIFNAAGMLLLITPVDRAAVPTAEVLQGLSDLTPAEARAARSIAGAHTIETTALTTGVSRETVRTQLKAVLAKTGLNRQGELVSLLAGSTISETQVQR